MTKMSHNRRKRSAPALAMLVAAAWLTIPAASAQLPDLQTAALGEEAFAETTEDAAPTAPSKPDAGPGAGPAQDFYCGQRRLGQWFYCERPRVKPSLPPAASAQASAADRMKAISARLNELKARAILEPSEANVVAYVRYQREQLDRASVFSDTWQRALWQNPELDYTLQRPVSTVAKRTWSDNRAATRDQALARLGRRYGMFYFFAQGCAACEVFSPILRSVADTHRMSVMAVSTDGGPSRQFPNYVVDSGQRARMGVPLATPALVLFDTVTRRTVPIGFGVMSADEVMERIFLLTNTKPGDDF